MKINVLIITKSAWKDTNAFGNTLTNFFSGCDDLYFSNLYLRNELPKNNIAQCYYQITEKQLAKHIICPNKIGNVITNPELNNLRNNEGNKIKMHKSSIILDFFRSNRFAFFLLFREFYWMLGRWRSKKLDEFLFKNKIDLIFAAAADPLYLQSIINYCQKKTGAKLVLFFADDIFSHKSILPLSYLYQLRLRHSISKSVKNASILYGASQNLCDEYKKYFGKDIEPLYKGCSFNVDDVKKIVTKPIRIVYAGNLYYNRWKILKALVDEIVNINLDGIKIKLEIYTTTTITKKFDKVLNRSESSKIIGSLPYEEIKKVLSSADIVLHVESFDVKQIKLTRLSFSTKIIDCMQSGSCMMAIGPSNVASIKYLENIKGTIVITELLKIRENINAIIENPKIIITNANSLRDYALEFHDINSVHTKLQSDFKKLLQIKDNYINNN